MVRGRQVKVRHRGLHARVPHPLLERQERDAAPSALGAEGVAEHVRVHPASVGGLADPFNPKPHPLAMPRTSWVDVGAKDVGRRRPRRKSVRGDERLDSPRHARGHGDGAGLAALRRAVTVTTPRPVHAHVADTRSKSAGYRARPSPHRSPVRRYSSTNTARRSSSIVGTVSRKRRASSGSSAVT